MNNQVRCEWCGRKLGTATEWAERVRSHCYEWDALYCSIRCMENQAEWRVRPAFETHGVHSHEYETNPDYRARIDAVPCFVRPEAAT